MSENLHTLASPERLEELLKETEAELSRIQPEIETLEEQVQKLRDLKLAKQRLLTLKMSLSALLETSEKDELSGSDSHFSTQEMGLSDAKLYSFSELSALKTFHPEEALKQIDKVLKQKGSLNYEMFKAVVFNGGKATTEDIKTYLVDCGIKQPQTGEGFEEMPLTEISSRANYLVRKGILQPLERGSFFTTLGWVEPE